MAVPIDIAMIAPLVIRRKSPLVAGYLILVVGCLILVVGCLILVVGAVHAWLEQGPTSVVTGVVAIYTLVVYTTRKSAALFVAILTVASAVQISFQYEATILQQLVALAALMAFPWVLGEFVGARRAYQRELEARPKLLENEREVLALVVRGRSNTEIATGLFLSEATVKTHVGRILSKLDLRDRVQAVVLAYGAGLVRPGA